MIVTITIKTELIFIERRYKRDLITFNYLSE